MTMNKFSNEYSAPVPDNVSMKDIKDSDKDVKTIIDGDVRARFKIQVNFGPGRSALKEFKAIFTVWESGKFFHGGGDGVMYLCLDHRLFEKDNTTPPSALPVLKRMAKGRTEWGCGSPIASSHIIGELAHCPGCQSMIPIINLTGQIPFCGTVNELAEMAAILFHNLGDDADIYCKYDRQDIRYRTQVEKKGAEEAHRLRGLFIYPLYRIMDDTAAGASLEGRFKAFFLA